MTAYHGRRIPPWNVLNSLSAYNTLTRSVGSMAAFSTTKTTLQTLYSNNYICFIPPLSWEDRLNNFHRSHGECYYITLGVLTYRDITMTQYIVRMQVRCEQLVDHTTLRQTLFCQWTACHVTAVSQMFYSTCSSQNQDTGITESGREQSSFLQQSGGLWWTKKWWSQLVTFSDIG